MATPNNPGSVTGTGTPIAQVSPSGASAQVPTIIMASNYSTNPSVISSGPSQAAAANGTSGGVIKITPQQQSPIIQYQFSAGGTAPKVVNVAPGASTGTAAGATPLAYSAVAPITPPRSESPSGFALSDFMQQLEDYAPTIPDAVTSYYLHQAGFDSTDPRMARLISIAAQKFISDIINESLIHCKLKTVGQNVGKNKPKDKKYVLTLEDLIPVLNDYGITVRKPPYYV